MSRLGPESINTTKYPFALLYAYLFLLLYMKKVV